MREGNVQMLGLTPFFLASKVTINSVFLWDTVKATANKKYRTDLPKNLQYVHQPVHYIAIDEQRAEFFNKDVLNVEGAMQIGFRGKHADLGGVGNNAFAWPSRILTVELSKQAGISFNQSQIPANSVDYAAQPSDNDRWFYNDGETRTFPKDMLIHPSVPNYSAYARNPYSGMVLSTAMKEGW